MANDTKERILAAAMEMISKNGYAGTNIRELSASLGLVKSGVYKHYESKEAIWNALLDEMIAYYADHFGSAEQSGRNNAQKVDYKPCSSNKKVIRYDEIARFLRFRNCNPI